MYAQFYWTYWIFLYEINVDEDNFDEIPFTEIPFDEIHFYLQFSTQQFWAWHSSAPACSFSIFPYFIDWYLH